MSHETALDVEQALRAFSRPDKVKAYQWFFKTGPGQYGEGDVFIGVRVPENRSVAKRFRNIGEAEITELTNSPIHELRQCGLFILVDKFKRAKTDTARQEHFDHYMHLVYEGRVNNWDLVDAILADDFQSVHTDGPRDKATEISMLKGEDLGQLSLTDFRSTRAEIGRASCRERVSSPV